MPIYSIRCSQCGKMEDVFRSIKEYDNLPDCCGSKMDRLIVAPMVVGDLSPYQSMVTGEMITSRSQHRDHLKQHGVVEVGNEKLSSKPVTPPPGLKETIARAVYEKL